MIVVLAALFSFVSIIALSTIKQSSVSHDIMTPPFPHWEAFTDDEFHCHLGKHIIINRAV